MPRLTEGWELACTPPGAANRPAALAPDLVWHPAPVPGTAALALQMAGLWQLDQPAPLHDQDIWYRLHAPTLGRGTLRFEGLATLSEVWVDDTLLLQSQTMYASYDVAADISGWLYLCFRALDTALAAKTGPRARWRTQLILDRRVRLLRTTLLGHLPDWCPAVHAVGPWRPVSFVPEGEIHLRKSWISARMNGDDGVVDALFESDGIPPGVPVRLQVGTEVADIKLNEPVAETAIFVSKPDQWWPHTHGTPTLYPVTLHIGDQRIELPPVGFRTVTLDSDMVLRVNAVPVFCRGAVWITPDIVRLGGDPVPSLTLMRDAGLNMVRVSGTGHYQDRAFHAACDVLGILVWQDLMFASMDYPTTDPAFVAQAVAEVAWALTPSPSLAVVCGGSEVAQQAAMMGLPASTWRDTFYTETLARAVKAAWPDLVYVPGSPWGTGWPFAPAEGGPTHYFGVGAYRRPLHDATTAGVRFASECLAFSHVPDHRVPDPLAHPPRDPGADWDFAEVREHYTGLLFEVDPAALEPRRYALLARATAAALLHDIVAGWRCPGVTQGALVWHWADFKPGAGWGVVDSAGRPKPAWHGLRQGAAPLLLVLQDLGLSGLAACIVNDGPATRTFTLRLRCLRDGAVVVAHADVAMMVAAHGTQVIAPSVLFPSFFDVTYAYRFGPPTHDVTTAWLEDDGVVVARAHHYPRGRAALGAATLQAALVQDAGGWALDVTTDRFALGVHTEDPAWDATEAWFGLPPGITTRVRLRGGQGVPSGVVQAVNAAPVAY